MSSPSAAVNYGFIFITHMFCDVFFFFLQVTGALRLNARAFAGHCLHLVILCLSALTMASDGLARGIK